MPGREEHHPGRSTPHFPCCTQTLSPVFYLHHLRFNTSSCAETHPKHPKMMPHAATAVPRAFLHLWRSFFSLPTPLPSIPHYPQHHSPEPPSPPMALGCLSSPLLSRGRQMDPTRVKRLKMGFSTLFQRETIPQLSQPCEGGAAKVIHGLLMDHQDTPEAGEMLGSDFCVWLHQLCHQPWVFQLGRDHHWYKPALFLLP